MGPFTNPLVVIEERATVPVLTRVIETARAHSSACTLLSIETPVPHELVAHLSPIVLAQFQSAMREQREARLLALASIAQEIGLSVHTVSREGVAFLVTIREVLRADHDLVLKAVDSDGVPEDGAALGSTDRHLLRKCPCALWLMRAGQQTSGRRILAAVDPDPREPQQVRLSESILRVAVSVAHGEAATLDVLHAWALPGESILREPQIAISDPEVDHLVGSALNRHVQYLDSLVDTTFPEDIELRRHVIRGTPGDVITSFVKANQVDLLVMGTIGRTGIAGLLIGNTAEKVINDVDCSILALKPDGFMTPVGSP